MTKNYLRIAIHAIVIALIGVFGVDYFSHLLFSNPMETGPYFLMKFALYFIFTIVFLSVINTRSKEFVKVAGAGVIVSLLWGAYYNVFPVVFGYYPLGISLAGLTFLGMSYFGTGLAFGIVHTLAFIVGYYVSTYWFKPTK